MSNIGVNLYRIAKKMKSIIGIQLTDGTFHAITTPRQGIIQIGAGFFMKEMLPNHTLNESHSNSIFRLSTLLHEARHSDGHGKSLGFFHAFCPQGHTYENINACDKNLNGPYSITAASLKSFTHNCKDCSKTEILILEMRTADAYDRILHTYFDPKTGETLEAKNWSETPEAMESTSHKL